MLARSEKHRWAWVKKSYFGAGGGGSLMMMPRPLSGCQMKAEIQCFLLMYRLFQYQQWVCQDIERRWIPEMTSAPFCNVIRIRNSLLDPLNK